MGADIYGVFQARKNGKWEDIPSEYNEDRDYLLFAWLGNVGNGFRSTGFITPLSDSRGFPDDFHVEGESHNIIWMGEHSYSWVSGEEVINAPSPRVVRHGIVTKEVFEKWDGKSKPENWKSVIYGAHVNVSTPDTINEHTTHVRIEWEEDATDELSYFVNEMKRLVEKHGEVRFVFGFAS